MFKFQDAAFFVRQPGPVALSMAALLTLAGCAATPLGPTVQVMPGRGKTFDTFQRDQATCKNFASEQVRGQADAANQSAVGTAVLTTVLSAGLGAALGGAVGDAGSGAAIGAAAGASGGTLYGAGNTSTAQLGIQQQYDNAFSQCMFSKGELVPGFGSGGVAMGGAAPDPLIQSTQTELIRLGYLRDTADGFMGQKTRTAISSFEQSNGLPVDGSPSPQLLARLQSTTAGGSASATASSSSNWVSPAGSQPAPASGKDWVSPSSAPPATPVTATGGGWVTPK